MENSFVITGDITTIFLKTKDGVRHETIIETDDLPRAMEFPRTWIAGASDYRTRVNVTGASMGLPRWLIMPGEGLQVDHINNNALDNRRSNLRACTRKENARNRKVRSDNTVGATGVYRRVNKWEAIIGFEGRLISLGRFENIADAIASRKEAEIKYFGEFRFKKD